MDSNSTNGTSNEQARRSDSEPGYRPSDLIIPHEVFAHIGTPLPDPKKQKLNLTFTPTHAFLIGCIGMYTHYRGVGCWASNRLLAEKLNITERRLRQLIEDCIQVGFVIDCGEQPVRFGKDVVKKLVLKTLWTGGVTREPGGRKSPFQEDSEDGNGLPGGRKSMSALREDKDRDSTENTAAPRSGSGGMENGEESEAPDSDDPDILQPPVKSPTAFDNGQKPAERGSAPTTPTKRKEGPVNQKFRSGAGDLLNPPIKGAPPDLTDAQRASRKLRDAIVRKYMHDSTYSESVWCAELEKLARQSGDWDRVHRAVDWYALNIGGRYVPKIRGVVEFRKKFDMLSDAISGAEEKGSSDHSISEEGQKLADDIEVWGWPRGSEQYLPRTISESLHNLNEFRETLFAAKLSANAHRFFHDADKVMGQNEVEIELWFKWVHKRVQNWPGFNGKLDYFIWTPHHDGALPRLCDLSQESPTPETWQEILAAYKEAR